VTIWACAGVRKTVAQRKTNTLAAPLHSQNPRYQKTESRKASRIGVAHDGSARVSSNRALLRKSPVRGKIVTTDHTHARAKDTCVSRCHVHQHAHTIPIARKPAAERPRNSCNRSIPKVASASRGTTKHAQIRAIIPDINAAALTLALRGAIVFRCRRKCSTNGSVKTPLKPRPAAASRW